MSNHRFVVLSALATSLSYKYPIHSTIQESELRNSKIHYDNHYHYDNGYEKTYQKCEAQQPKVKR